MKLFVAAVGLQVHSGPTLGHREKDPLLQRVSGLSHDSMCGRPWSPLCWNVSSVVLVWSLLYFFFFFSFWNLHVNVTAVCSAGLLVCSFWASFENFNLQTSSSPQTNAHISTPHFWPPLSCSCTSTHSCTHPHTPQHTEHNTIQTPLPTAQLPLCLVMCVSLQLLTDFLVFLQSRKASEQAKSVDSKTDSIGSGRAIPIKQVSTSNLLNNAFFSPQVRLSWVFLPLLLWDLMSSSLWICAVLFSLPVYLSVTTRWQHNKGKRYDKSLTTDCLHLSKRLFLLLSVK